MPMMWDGATEMGDDQAITAMERAERALHDLVEGVRYAQRAQAKSAALEKDTAAAESRRDAAVREADGLTAQANARRATAAREADEAEAHLAGRKQWAAAEDARLGSAVAAKQQEFDTITAAVVALRKKLNELSA